MSISKRIISAHLPFALMVTFGCDPGDYEDSSDLADSVDVLGENLVDVDDKEIVVAEDDEMQAFEEHGGVSEPDEAHVDRSFEISAAPNPQAKPFGQCCWAMCSWNPGYYYMLSWVKSDCNAQASSWCKAQVKYPAYAHLEDAKWAAGPGC